MQTNQTNKNMRIFVVLGAIMAVVVVLLISLQITASRNANVDFIAVPDDARFEIAGKTYKAGKHNLPLGSASITAKREGFADSTQRVTVTDQLQQVRFALTAESTEARAWVKNNAEQYTDLEAQAGQQAEVAGETFRLNNPIITILPYRGVLFSIDYKVSRQNPDDITLQIRANSSANRSFALQHLTKAGYDLSDYRIEFTDYTNPLKGVSDDN